MIKTAFKQISAAVAFNKFLVWSGPYNYPTEEPSFLHSFLGVLASQPARLTVCQSSGKLSVDSLFTNTQCH